MRLAFRPSHGGEGRGPVTALHTALKGRHVQFRLRDVHLPDPAVIFRQLHGDDVIEGEVLDATESVIGGGVFLVIQVDGLLQPLILAAERIPWAWGCVR